MSTQDSNVCATCGGVIPQIHQWKPLDQMTFPKIETPYLDRLRSAERKKYCPGHPEPAPKHDGSLDNRDQDNNFHATVGLLEDCYWRGDGGKLVDISGGIGDYDSSRVLLEPIQALSLRDWLIQESPGLERLAKEQER